MSYGLRYPGCGLSIMASIGRRSALTTLAAALGAPILLSGCTPLTRNLADYQHFVAAVAEATLPGAGRADIVAWIVAGAAAGLFGSSLPALDKLEILLNRRASGNYAGRTAQRQAELLRAMDADVYAGRLPRSGWGPLKTLILAGYYTSQTGAATELHYELAPGALKADVPLTDFPVPLSNDWTAVAMRQKAPA